MTYASLGIIALLVMLIINCDILFNRSGSKMKAEEKSYRLFLYSVLFYYVTDIAWGFLDACQLITTLFVETTVYFIALSLSVLLWTRYVIRYLNEKNLFCSFIRLAGMIFFGTTLVSLIVNFFIPLMFYIDGNGNYHTGILRYVLFGFQIVLFTLTSLYALLLSFRGRGKKGRRYRTIGLFGMNMVAAITIQVYFPLMPLYSLGCLLGTCLLHTFVLEDEKQEYQKRLEDLLKREKEHRKALGSARQLAYTDPLTGVKNKSAYVEAVSRLDQRISEGTVQEFGVVVFDLNDLKIINDTQGHEEGDKYIQEGCQLICRIFSHSPVFRIGGDEFAVLLEGSDFLDRERLVSDFNRRVDDNMLAGRVIISMGIDLFDPGEDQSMMSVFERADSKMYERKRLLKERKKKR